MDNTQTRYEVIEANLRMAMEGAKQIGDDFLVYLVEIALLETCMKTAEKPETGGETRARRGC